MNQRHRNIMNTIICSVFGTLRQHPWLTSEVFTKVVMGGEFEDERYRAFRVRPELINHPPFISDEDPVDISEDAYGLFMWYAAALEYSAAGKDDPTPDRWGMNEANIEWEPGDDPSHVAWFQVSSEKFTTGIRPPIQPIVMCARETLSRFGELALTGTQIMLPLPLTNGPHWRSMLGLNWFGLSNPAARTPVRITLDSGVNDDVPRKAADIIEVLRQPDTGWTFDDYTTAKPTAPPLETDIAYSIWMGEGHQTMTVEATAPEWNLPAAGWVTELCADACRAVGVDSTVLVSVTNQQ